MKLRLEKISHFKQRIIRKIRKKLEILSLSSTFTRLVGEFKKLKVLQHRT